MSKMANKAAAAAFLCLAPSFAGAESLSAIGSAAASAHTDIGQEVKQLTPEPGSLTITVGAAASDAVENDMPPPDRWEMDTIVDGIGTARYGSLAGRAHAEGSSLPASSFFLAGGEVNMILGFSDEAEVQSDTLADGTPVTLTFLLTLEASAIHVTDVAIADPNGTGASARLEVAVRDTESIQNLPVLGALVINSRGTVEPSKTIQLSTAIGHRVELDAELFVSAGVDLDFAANGFSQATADVIADQTGELVFQPSGDVRLVADSGHDYAVPEPGGPALLLASLPAWLWRRRSSGRSRS
jgi:hypothetical protein